MEGKVNYTVTVHEEDGQFWAEIEELPGCFAAGDTMDELWESLTDAVGAYLSVPGSSVDVKMTGQEVMSQSHATETRVLLEC